VFGTSTLGTRGEAIGPGIRLPSTAGNRRLGHAVIACIPVSGDGSVDPRWGRAACVAVADVRANGIQSWQEFAVGWGHLHDSGPEGEHHARIARFLKHHEVQLVVADHMGPPMEHMLIRMGIAVRLGTRGQAKEAVLEASANPQPDRHP
jgi:predicted Fe-Mo cluster-binding NifX family protein